MKMRDVMIEPVICAEEWQTLGHIGRLMLLNEFTILPYREQSDDWTFIEATEVVRALSEDRNKRLDMTVGCAVKCGLLRVVPAEEARAEEEINHSKPATILVVRGARKAVAGLVTPFDLL